MAVFTLRIFVIWLPIWKWMSFRQSCMWWASSVSRASSNSLLVSPNFEASPPDSSHLPEPTDANLIRMPIFGRTPSRSDTFAMSSNSLSFSATI